MVKFIFYVLLIPTVLISINKDFNNAEASSYNGYRVTYNSPIYDPIEPYSSLSINGIVSIKEGTHKDKLRVKYELYSIYRYEGNKAYSSGYASSLFNYSYPIDIAYSFTINDNVADFARSGILVKLGIYDTVNRSYIHYIERTLYSKKNNVIDINELSGDLTLDHSFSFSEEDTSEAFNFSNYSDIVEIPYYHHLDLSSLSFTYKGYKFFSYKRAYLAFKDKYNLFPYIKEEDGYKVIELKANDNSGLITFSTSNLYVNIDTFMMSSFNKESYVNTNYFYFPKNQLNKLQGLSLMINIVEMGVFPSSFNYSFAINFNALLMGPCNLSEFCIVGGVKK